mmetsp:Transcript_25997/g.71317  ORF Transcript_25997/g.71317 Transcript_25997/m.71317 type:complete len:244 (+) Transcript_25997:192-923(+)
MLLQQPISYPLQKSLLLLRSVRKQAMSMFQPSIPLRPLPLPRKAKQKQKPLQLSFLPEAAAVALRSLRRRTSPTPIATTRERSGRSNPRTKKIKTTTTAKMKTRVPSRRNSSCRQRMLLPRRWVVPNAEPPPPKRSSMSRSTAPARRKVVTMASTTMAAMKTLTGATKRPEPSVEKPKPSLPEGDLPAFLGTSERSRNRARSKLRPPHPQISVLPPARARARRVLLLQCFRHQARIERSTALV